MRKTALLVSILALSVWFDGFAAWGADRVVVVPLFGESSPSPVAVNPVGSWHGTGGHRLIGKNLGMPSGYEKNAVADVVIESLSGSDNEGYKLTITLLPYGYTGFTTYANGIFLDSYITGMVYSTTMQQPFGIKFISNNVAILEYHYYYPPNGYEELFIIKLSRI